MKKYIVFIVLNFIFTFKIFSQIDLLPESKLINKNITDNKFVINENFWMFKFTNNSISGQTWASGFKIVDESKLKDNKSLTNWDVINFSFPSDLISLTEEKRYVYEFYYYYDGTVFNLLYINQIVISRQKLPPPNAHLWGELNQQIFLAVSPLCFGYMQNKDKTLFDEILKFVTENHYKTGKQLNLTTTSSPDIERKPNIYAELLKNQMDYNLIQGNYFLYKYNPDYMTLYNSVYPLTTTPSGITSDKNFFVDLLFPSRLTISHSLLKDSDFIGVMGLGFELNITPDRSWLYSSGASPYLSISPIFLIKSMFWVFKLTEIKISYNTKYNFNEYLKIRNRVLNGFEKHYGSKVNFNEGISIEGSVAITSNLEDIVTGNPSKFGIGLPFVNFYYSSASMTGSKLEKPDNIFSNEFGKYAYFFNQEYEVSTSFYLSLDDNKVNTLKFDLGVGGMQLFKVYYDDANKVTMQEKFISSSKIMPSVGVSYNYLSSGLDNTGQDKPGAMFGVKAKFFNDRIRLNPWIKLYKSEPFELRLEDLYISKPLFRTYQEWEPPADNSVYLRMLLNF